ncbi:unnamed protein product [Rotaria sordida]|uniref:Fido domain-containing protein n=1 Tax=Rotaria sordida TaxID=392033 RepID=A0A814SSH4_9BILA|nr:unnamed protein product [Rotaria sordida]CAF1527580.1 unnamed protein product [Rotaria sordida]
MIQEVDKMISDYLVRIKKYEDEVEHHPIDKFYYKWEGLQALNYQEHENSVTNVIYSEQISFMNSQPLPSLFTLDYLKQLHAEHIQYAPYTSQYVPELQAQIRILIPSGRFKLTPNSATRKDGKLFQFCPPSQVEEQVKLLFSLYEKYEKENIDPIVLAAWFHAEFIRIHPFVDGNGRIGRLLSSKILMKNDLLPLIVEKRNKNSANQVSKTRRTATNNNAKDHQNHLFGRSLHVGGNLHGRNKSI